MEVPQLYVKVLEAANLNLPFSQGTIRFILSAPPLELKGVSTALSNNPKWKDEEFVFHVQDHESNFSITLVVEDKNKERVVRLSSVSIPLSTLTNEQPHEAWFELVPNEKNYTMLYRESHIISTSSFIGTESSHTNVHNPHEAQRIHLKLHYTFSQGTDLGSSFSLMQPSVSDFANLLLYDGTWLVNALCESIDIADSQRVAQALVRVFEYFKNTRTLLRTVIAKEVNTTESTGTLFRSNSMAMKLLSVYAQVTGQQYLRSTLAAPIGDIVADARSVEMDPSKLKPGEDLEENAHHLQSQAQNVLDRILASIDQVPREIRETCLFLREHVVERFPDHWYIALGGFFFLRYVCPACVAPEGAGVINDVPEPRRRALVLVTKVLQQLANGQEFAGKEAYMRPMNSFIVLNTPRLSEFFQRLVMVDLTTTEESHLQIRPYAVMNDLVDLRTHLKTHNEKMVQVLTKNAAPNIVEVQRILDAFTPPASNRVEKIHNITSEQLLQLGAIKIPTIDLRTSGGLTSSGGAKAKGDEELILNDWPIYTGSSKDANVLAENLLRSLLALYTAHTLSCSHSTNKDSKLEDRWKHIEQADQFEIFKNDLTELQKVNLDPLNELQLIAFFINIFNTLCIHLYVNTYGNLMNKRTGCLLLHKYRIGDSEYSMMDILHILRGNPKNHITRHRHIRGGDVRRRYVMAKVDCRIHFALSYLTVTDPFIHVISHSTVEEDLMNAGMEFCQKHITVDSSKKEVVLPELFHKYASDFGMSKDELFSWLFPYLSKETRIRLVELMERKTTVIYAPSSTLPQTLPPSTFSTSSGLGSSPPSTAPLAHGPLARNDSAAAMERYSNRVRSSTMGVHAGTRALTPPRPIAREESAPFILYAHLAENPTGSLPHTRVQQNTNAKVNSPMFFGQSLANTRSESASSVLMTPTSPSESISFAPSLPTSNSSPQLHAKLAARSTSQATIISPPSSPGVHPTPHTPSTLPTLSPTASPVRSPNPPRTIERSVSAFTLHSPSRPPSLWPTSPPGSPDPVKQRLTFNTSPTAFSPPSTPTKSNSSTNLTSPPPLFLGCVDYYPLLSPAKAPALSIATPSQDLSTVNTIKQTSVAANIISSTTDSATPLARTSSPPPESVPTSIPSTNTATSSVPSVPVPVLVPVVSEPVSSAPDMAVAVSSAAAPTSSAPSAAAPASSAPVPASSVTVPAISAPSVPVPANSVTAPASSNTAEGISAPVPASAKPVPVSPAGMVRPSSAPAKPSPAKLAALKPTPKPISKELEPELAGVEGARAKPTKTRSTSTMDSSTGQILAKSPSLSASASSSSIMSTKSSLTSSPSAPNLNATSTTQKVSIKSPSPSTVATPAAPVLPSPRSTSTPNQKEPLKQEMLAKLHDISSFLRSNIDTTNRDVEYMMGLAQIVTYMKKQLESPLHTTTGKFQFRGQIAGSIDPLKQETLISSVTKAVRLLREKVHDYKAAVKAETDTMAVCIMKNICLSDIKEGLELFKVKFPAT